MNKTIDNFAAGVFGKGLLIIGLVVLFKSFFIGLIICIFGCYLAYKSKTYVHNGGKNENYI